MLQSRITHYEIIFCNTCPTDPTDWWNSENFLQWKKRDHTKTNTVIGFKENYQELGNIYENGNTQAIPTILWIGRNGINHQALLKFWQNSFKQEVKYYVLFTITKKYLGS